MEDHHETILVPWDFTPVAECALEHAFRMAKKIDCKSITLLHIIKKSREYDDAHKRLTLMAGDFSGKNGVKVEVEVSVGSIFTTIAEKADELKASLVIMGTHGIKGMQKLTGSWALKVIVSSKVPFVVVQEPPHENDMEKVIFPVDFKRENKEILNWVSYLSHFYKLKFYIIKPNTTDLGFIKRIKGNIAFARRFLDSKNIDYEIHAADGKKSFAVETIEYAREIHADMIIVMSTKNIGLADYVIGASEQYIIANAAKIPVMVINPREDLTRFGSFG